MDYSATKDIIEQSNFLSKEDTAFVADNIQTLQENWDKKQRWRTETEMRVSVLDDINYPTAASKYWQCIREQSVFYEQLVILSFAYRRNKLHQNKKLKEIKKQEDPDNKDLLKIDLEELRFNQVNMEVAARERMREIRLWTALMKELDDGSFDTDDVNSHQLISYGHTFDRKLKTMGNSASPSERSNIIGQFNTAMRHLDDRGLLKQDRFRQKGE